MATLASNKLHLVDAVKRTDASGNILPMVELLAEMNPILDDMPVIEANQTFSHVSSVRTGIPSGTWRRLYGGVQPEASRAVQVTDQIGNLEAYSEIDAMLVESMTSPAEFRLQESRAFLEGLAQEMATTVFYGDEGTANSKFTGLAPRFNDQSAANGGNILTSAATPDNSDNTSIYLVGWGPSTVFGIYPKGSVGGLQRSDKGKITSENIDGAYGRAEIYREHFKWALGLCVRDWRYVVRINFDLEDIVASAATGPDLTALMAKAIRRIPYLSSCRPVFYGNRDALDALDLQCNNKNTLALGSVLDAQGRVISTFRGIPVRQCDALLSTESGV